MSVTLSQTRVRPDDQTYEVAMIGANYDSNRVVVRVRFASGDTQDVIFEGPRLAALRNAVTQFNGLRGAIETYLSANEPGLEGTP
jgi:hypothetical protein